MTRNKNVGNAGEFYVLAQLAQRGYIAGKTDDGQTLKRRKEILEARRLRAKIAKK